MTLWLERVSRSYGSASPRVVLNDVSLELAPGEYIAITGESGVGKSTLLNIVAGLDVPDSGAVRLDGVELTGLNDDALTRLRREKMGFVFQAFHLLPYLSVRQNVALPLALLGGNVDETRSRVDEVLAAVGLQQRSSSPPHELSGGEMQRVAIARALVNGPRLILADEPTGNLDPETAGRVLELLRSQIKRTGAAGILVTHSPDAARTTDRIYRLTPAGLVVGS